MQFLSLFLKRDTFLVFSRLADGDKKKAKDVKAKLEEAFCVSKEQAYKLFTARRLRQDESVTTYAADLERLAALAGHSVTADDAMVVEQLTTGLPGHFARQGRLSFAGEDDRMSALIEKVRALCVSSSDANSTRNVAEAATGPHSSSASSTFVPRGGAHSEIQPEAERSPWLWFWNVGVKCGVLRAISLVNAEKGRLGWQAKVEKQQHWRHVPTTPIHACL